MIDLNLSSTLDPLHCSFVMFHCPLIKDYNFPALVCQSKIEHRHPQPPMCRFFLFTYFSLAYILFATIVEIFFFGLKKQEKFPQFRLFIDFNKIC